MPSVQHRHRSWLLTCGALLLGLALPFLAPALASAHAYPVSASVGPDATLKSAPDSITIHFAENVNPNGSDIVVYDVNGKVVSTSAQVDRSDLKAMTVQMHGDGSSTYLVEWHTVSADDGDPDIGGYTFAVDSNAKTTNANSQNFGTATTPPASTSNGVPAWVIVGVGIAGLLIGAGAMAAVQRRQTKPAA